MSMESLPLLGFRVLGVDTKNSNPKFTGKYQAFHYTFIFNAYVLDGAWRYLHHEPFLYEKSPKNLITTRKHCVYKAFGAYKTNYEILTENFAYLPICAATSAAKSSCFFSKPSPVSKRTNLLTETVPPTSLETSSKYFATICLPSAAFTYT